MYFTGWTSLKVASKKSQSTMTIIIYNFCFGANVHTHQKLGLFFLLVELYREGSAILKAAHFNYVLCDGYLNL